MSLSFKIYNAIVGFTLVLLFYKHYTLFLGDIRKINVDKIIPECFRSNCGYYKDFYQKTPKPFSKEISGIKIELLRPIERKDYNNTQWNIKWEGKSLKKKGVLYKDESEVALFNTLPSSDRDRIAETVKNESTPNSQKHEQKHTIQKENRDDQYT